jgi:perosamine synthetase
MTSLSAPAFPPPRIPNSPVLSFGAVFDSPDVALVPSVVDRGAVVELTSGRAALANAIKLIGVRPGDSVMLPAYNCRSMVDAIAWTGAVPLPYKSHNDLTADLTDIAGKLDDRVRCIVAVHYFGRPHDLAALRALCDQRGIALIEDCAHCFFGRLGETPVGSVGDFAIASPMKFFPIYDGGVLVSARNRLNGLTLRSGGVGFQLTALLNSLERSFGYRRLRPFNWLMAPFLHLKDKVWSFAKSFRAPLARQALGPDTSSGSYEFDPKWVDIKMSAASHAFLRSTSISRLIARRRRNYRAMHDAFSSQPGCRPFFEYTPEEVVPYVFPLVVDDPDKAFPLLKSRGVPLFRWEQVDVSVCDVATRLSQQLFQLPCHQELSARDVRWLIAEVKHAVAP